MRDVGIRNYINIKRTEPIDELIKDIVRFTHKRDIELTPIIETPDFYDGIKYTLAYLKETKNIEL